MLFSNVETRKTLKVARSRSVAIAPGISPRQRSDPRLFCRWKTLFCWSFSLFVDRMKFGSNLRQRVCYFTERAPSDASLDHLGKMFCVEEIPEHGSTAPAYRRQSLHIKINRECITARRGRYKCGRGQKSIFHVGHTAWSSRIRFLR